MMILFGVRAGEAGMTERHFITIRDSTIVVVVELLLLKGACVCAGISGAVVGAMVAACTQEQAVEQRLVGVGYQVGHLLGESNKLLCKCGKHLLHRLVIGTMLMVLAALVWYLAWPDVMVTERRQRLYATAKWFFKIPKIWPWEVWLPLC